MMIQFLLFSCQNNLLDDLPPQIPEDGPLFEVISTYPGWRSDWNRLGTTGTPLPDQAVKVFGLSGKGYYVVPVANGMEIVRLALYPLTSGEGGQTVTSSPAVVEAAVAGMVRYKAERMP